MNSTYSLVLGPSESLEQLGWGLPLLLGTMKGVFTQETGIMGVGVGAAVTSQKARGQEKLGNLGAVAQPPISSGKASFP